MLLKSATNQWKLLLVFLLGLVSFGPALADSQAVTKKVTIPDEDRFLPFALTIHVGDSVQWTNNDTDDHTIVAVSAFTNTDHKTVNHLILGTDNNGGNPGVFKLKFNVEGRFTYHCRFHAKLDAHHQPIAPGPRGGIQSANGNFGTPMMGVITVLHD
jgi:plastocyanin